MYKKIVHYALVFLCFLAACHVAKKLPETTDTTSSFDIQGHRGCRGLMPENTIPAMKKALDLGVTTLEMDIVFTKDKWPILSHEPFFNHEITTKPDGSPVTEKEEKSLNIYNMDYAEVKKYDVGMRSHPRFPRQEKINVYKPLLSDLLDSVDEYMKTSKRPLPYFNIETKSDPASDNIYHPAPDEFIDRLMAVIRSKKIEDRVIIQSFDFRTLRYLHEKYPSIKTAMLIEDFDERGIKDQLKALGFTPTVYSPEHKMVTEELVKKCHEQNIKIIPWTVNDKERIEELKKMGVDGIISDYPDLF
ncbi:glycerophosphodiester phosphodiesterase [Terrimonas alba]|uniref:glycerophosphodiester phosphodiesterase n=1 Tax=Terrimonas alba TaxID=3349636 RepID=UPI0035F4C27B